MQGAASESHDLPPLLSAMLENLRQAVDGRSDQLRSELEQVARFVRDSPRPVQWDIYLNKSFVRVWPEDAARTLIAQTGPGGNSRCNACGRDLAPR
jgi:hypothetical protein